jgi:hypothetical protein
MTSLIRQFSQLQTRYQRLPTGIGIGPNLMEHYYKRPNSATFQRTRLKDTSFHRQHNDYCGDTHIAALLPLFSPPHISPPSNLRSTFIGDHDEWHDCTSSWQTQPRRLSAQRCIQSLCACRPSGPTDQLSGLLKQRHSSSWQPSRASEPTALLHLFSPPHNSPPSNLQSTIIIQGPCLPDMFKTLQNTLQIIEDWCKEHRLEISKDKSALRRQCL